MTVAEVLRQTERRLAEADIPDAAFDAKQLTAAAFRTDAHRLAFLLQTEAEEPSPGLLNEMITQRMAHRPLQYILGEWAFYGLPFFVGEGVLIPRPDTETLVEQALAFIRKTGVKQVVDLCAGSGCVSIAIAKNAPGVHVTAIEYDADAYAYTVRNIGLNLCYTVEALKRDLFDGPQGLQADLIVSNPPYIPRDDLPELMDEVKREPAAALDGGADGLDFYRGICDLWLPALNSGGALMAEVGIGQAGDVAELYRQAGLCEIAAVNDLSGIPRVVCGVKK